MNGIVGDIGQWLSQFLLWLPGMLIGFVMHEFSHALVADRLGDRTPRIMGRLTLNPLAHIDPIGFLMLLLVHFGWAKPVMTDPRQYKKLKRHGFAVVSVAGVTMNLILGFVFLFVCLFLMSQDVLTPESALTHILTYAAQINFILMVFNLIPIPPLDGYNILKDLVLVKHVRPQTLWNFEQYGRFLLIALVLLGGTSSFIGAASDFFFNAGAQIFNLIFHTNFVWG